MILTNVFTRPIWAGIFWGCIGGLALIAVTVISKNGLVQISPYILILCATTLSIKYSKRQSVEFNDMFKGGLIAFIISSLFLYCYILEVINPNSGISFGGHLLRFAAIIVFGTIGSSIVSLLAKPLK